MTTLKMAIFLLITTVIIAAFLGGLTCQTVKTIETRNQQIESVLEEI